MISLAFATLFLPVIVGREHVVLIGQALGGQQNVSECKIATVKTRFGRIKRTEIDWESGVSPCRCPLSFVPNYYVHNCVRGAHKSCREDGSCIRIEEPSD